MRALVWPTGALGPTLQSSWGLARLRKGAAKESCGDLTWQSILSDCVESIIVAVKEDSGFAEALALTFGLRKSRIARLDKSSFAKDAKSRLRDLLRRQGLPDPEYRLKSIQGNPLNRARVFSCSIPSLRLNAVGRGPDKKRQRSLAPRRCCPGSSAAAANGFCTGNAPSRRWTRRGRIVGVQSRRGSPLRVAQ